MKVMHRFVAAVAAGLIAVVGAIVPTAAKADGLRFAIYSPTENTCLDVKDYSTAPGAIVQTYSCTGATNQLWSAEVFAYSPDGAELLRLVNVGSGLCLDLVYAGTNPGIGLLQAPCNGSGTQAWRLPAPSVVATRQIFVGATLINYADASPVYHRQLSNQASGLCIQPSGGGQVTQQACGAATTWRVPVF